MDEYHNVRRELQDGHAFLTMRASMSVKLIANVANVTEAEVRRLIELARQSEK